MATGTLTLEQVVGHTLRKWDGIVLAGREDDGVKAWLAVIRAALEAAVAQERAALREWLAKGPIPGPGGWHEMVVDWLDARASADAGQPEPAE